MGHSGWLSYAEKKTIFEDNGQEGARFEDVGATRRDS